MDLTERVKTFPNSPGVYLMKDVSGRVIYVGKANNLKKRVASYLNEKDTRYQIRFLMKRTRDLDTIVTDNEKEALLLENILIKKHHPRYNIDLRDDKSFPSLKLSIGDRFPRLYVTRRIKKDGSLYFGPYTSAAAARETAEFIEKYFRLRNCSDQELANRVRPCLQYQIHRCDAPCVGWVDEARYREVVDQAKLFLQGKNQDLVKILEEEMRTQSSQEEFEKAAKTRDLITSISTTLEKQKIDRHRWIDQDVVAFHREGERLTFCLLMIREGKVWESRIFHLKGHGEDEEVLESFLNQFYSEERFVPDEILLSQSIPSLDLLKQILIERRGKKLELQIPQRGDKRDLVQLALRNAREAFQQRTKKKEEIKEVLDQLQELLSLQNFPRRIEGFDISNIGGEEAVGSLVCFVEGVSFKEGYRKFKIKTVDQANDFAMMQEVLHRRLSRIESKPDLLVIDGGKGQLNAVRAVMEELNITGIDLVSLAKEKDGEDQDKVFLPGRKNPVLLGRHSNVLHLLMRVRDEAHRFAITYHRKLRQKKFLR